MDYTPYARDRDEEIENWGEKNGIEVLMLEDYLLFPIETLIKMNGEPYTIYTPFKNAGLKKKNEIRKVNKKKLQNLSKIPSNLKSLTIDLNYVKIEDNDNILVEGGRKHGLKILKILKNLLNMAKKGIFVYHLQECQHILNLAIYQLEKSFIH